MLIIIEGFDNSGKSSLIEFIQNNLTFPEDPIYFHSEKGINQYARLFQILKETYRQNSIVISDRIGLIGEEVYGRVLRGHSDFDEIGGFVDSWKTFLRAFNSGPTPELHFIFCRPSKFNMGTKEEMEGVRENQKALRKAYDRAISEAIGGIKMRAAVLGLKYTTTLHDYCKDPDYAAIKKLFWRYVK